MVQCQQKFGAGNEVDVRLELTAGWRQKDDVSWRASSWPLRRVALGGLLSKSVTNEERKELDMPDGNMALRVVHVGQYAPHDVAKRAGFLKDDILISFNNRTDLLRKTDLLAYALNKLKPGSEVPVTILRKGKQMNMGLPISK